MASIGSWTLIVALVVSCYGAVAAFIARRRQSSLLADSAEKTLWLVAGLATVACGILLAALLTHKFQIQYVYGHSSTQLPVIYRISAFWAGEQGSLLLWFWFVAGVALVAVLRRNQTDPARPHLVTILSLTNAFFAALILLTSNPFDIYPVIPSEGAGMLPLLRNPGMILHPPILFLGYAAYTIPFASALAALWSNSLNTDWLERTRRWSLFAWATLGAGILIGAWWAYVELGWGGFWAWDPVENASLIPWLVGTAFLHSTIVEERVGRQRRWNLILPALTFTLCLFATLVTRGGIIVSDLHGFSSSIQPIAIYLFVAIFASLLAMLALTIRRRRIFSELSPSESLVSRETGFLLANVVLCAIAAIVFIGTIYPSLVKAISGNLVSLGASFFNRVASPFMLVVIALLGICPWLVWGRTPGKTARRLILPLAVGVLADVLLFVFGVHAPSSLVAAFVSAFVAVSLLTVVVGDLVAAARGKKAAASIAAMAAQLRRSHRRYGAHLVHFAMVLIVIGVTGAMLHKSEQLVSLTPGESVLFEGYTLTYEGFGVDTIDQFPATYESHERYETALSVTRGESSSARILRPEKNYHWVLDSPWVTEVAISSTLFEDLYVVLASAPSEDEGGLASFELVLNPLISWLWIGGALLLVGALLAAWPTRRRTVKGAADV
ncbi:heme lyase CcmF/NrfE family subunit [Candidatus Bipolaricaulota bacterium]